MQYTIGLSTENYIFYKILSLNLNILKQNKNCFHIKLYYKNNNRKLLLV